MIYVLGGGSRIFSVIAVTYPAGSICTCTKGNKALKAKDRSGKALFNVPEAGDWLVECQTEDGSKKKSQIVKISEASESFAVVLTYELVLFENGTYAPETGGWSDIHGNVLRKSEGANNMSGSYGWGCMTNNTVDITGYSQLHFTVKRYSRAYYPQAIFGIGKEKQKHLAKHNFSNDGGPYPKNYMVDIAKLSGKMYVSLEIGGAASQNGYPDGTTTVEISKVWLT